MHIDYHIIHINWDIISLSSGDLPLPPPLDYETGLTGELWLQTNLIKSQI